MTVTDEATARTVFETDQMQEEMAGLARVAGSYFTGLIAAGMERDEALGMTRDWQEMYLAHLYGARFDVGG